MLPKTTTQTNRRHRIIEIELPRLDLAEILTAITKETGGVWFNFAGAIVGNRLVGILRVEVRP